MPNLGPNAIAAIRTACQLLGVVCLLYVFFLFATRNEEKDDENEDDEEEYNEDYKEEDEEGWE